MTEVEYKLLLDGFDLKGQLEWERTRLICLYAANGDKMKGIKDIKKIIKLPRIDNKEDDGNDKRMQRIEELKRQAGLIK